MTSILTFYIATMGLSRAVFKIDSDFSGNRKIFPPLVFCAPLNGFSLELGIGTGVKKLE